MTTEILVLATRLMTIGKFVFGNITCFTKEKYVCLDGTNSEKFVITCGVPQGSILGLLFIIYINHFVQSKIPKYPILQMILIYFFYLQYTN